MKTKKQVYNELVSSIDSELSKISEVYYEVERHPITPIDDIRFSSLAANYFATHDKIEYALFFDIHAISPELNEMFTKYLSGKRIDKLKIFNLKDELILNDSKKVVGCKRNPYTFENIDTIYSSSFISCYLKRNKQKRKERDR